MQDIVEQIPSEEDERIYALWQSGKTLRTCAREMGISPLEVEYAIDRCLPPFSSASQLRAYKRDLQRLDDVGSYYYTKAMAGDLDSAHIYARINERRSSMSGWSSVNVRLDPVAAQTAERPSQHERIKDAIMRLAKGPNWRQLVDERLNDLPTNGAASDESRENPDNCENQD